MSQLSGQLEQELSIHRDMAQRAKRFEVGAADMAERLRIAEGELAAGSVLRDGFKFDKEKVRPVFLSLDYGNTSCDCFR